MSYRRGRLAVFSLSLHNPTVQILSRENALWKTACTLLFWTCLEGNNSIFSICNTTDWSSDPWCAYFLSVFISTSKTEEATGNCCLYFQEMCLPHQLRSPPNPEDPGADIGITDESSDKEYRERSRSSALLAKAQRRQTLQTNGKILNWAL